MKKKQIFTVVFGVFLSTFGAKAENFDRDNNIKLFKNNFFSSFLSDINLFNTCEYENIAKKMLACKKSDLDKFQKNNDLTHNLTHFEKSEIVNYIKRSALGFTVNPKLIKKIKALPSFDGHSYNLRPKKAHINKNLRESMLSDSQSTLSSNESLESSISHTYNLRSQTNNIEDKREISDMTSREIVKELKFREDLIPYNLRSLNKKLEAMDQIN